MPHSLLISCVGRRHATCLGAETKDACQRVGGALVGFVAATSFAVNKEGRDKGSCKQSADQRSNTCSMPSAHLWGETGGGGVNGMGRGCPLEWIIND